MHGERLFLADLALVLCVAAFTTVVFRRLRQPVVLGYLLAGVIVGPHTNTPLFLFADQENLEVLSELGVILVMFAIGLEFSLRRLASVLPRAGPVAALQLGAMLALGYGAGRLLGWSATQSLFAGAIVSVSSTMIIARVLAEEPQGRELSDLVLGVLVIEDVAAILMLALLTALASGGDASGVLLGTSARLAGFLLLLIVGGYLVVPRGIRLVAKQDSKETLLVASVGLCFALALLAHAAGYSVALGAFLAGALIAESGKHHQVEALVSPLRDLFAAVFFVAVGTLVDPLAVLARWDEVLLFSVLVVVGKVVSVTLGAFLSGYRPATALKAAMTMPQIGEFSFILAGVGVASGAIEPALYGIAVSVSVITTFLTPALVRASDPLALALEHRLPRPLRTFASLYASWLEELHARPDRSPLRALLRRRLGWILVDLACLAGIVYGTARHGGRLVELLVENAGLGTGLARTLVLVLELAVSLPFLVGVVRLVRVLGLELATVALPDRAAGGRDLAHAPRRAFVVTIQLALLMALLGPLCALLATLVPPVYPLVLGGLALALLAWMFWRRASELEAHARAGAALVIEVLARQAHDERPSLEAVHPLLEGMGELVPVRIAEGSVAVGQTLAQLDLRARTGATVLAITRPGGHVQAPTGRELLQVGDVLALTGTAAAVVEARARLERPQRRG